MLKVVAALLGFLACLAAVVVLIILIWPPSSVAVVLAGADYADNLLIPHNILGWKGLEAIDALAKTPPRRALFKPAKFELIGSLHKLDQPDDWDKLVKDLVKSRFKQQTILIVLALHGGSDSEGAYLCPDRMARPQERLDLSHVIESMADLPPEKQKILVLEGAQVPSIWQLGMLHNDFARRLDTLEGEIRKVPNLWVLSGADKDQRCWASEGLGRTVFSHFLIEGLRGKAVDSDGQLTLDKLHSYVRENVTNWVWNARGAIQEPVLVPRPAREGRGGDVKEKAESKPNEKAGKPPASRVPGKVVLAAVEHAPAAETPAPPDLATVRQVWQTFHQLDALSPHPAVYSPRQWSQYRALLVRYEALIRAGGAAKADHVGEQINALAGRLKRARILGSLTKSIENTLAMNVVAGGPLETTPVVPQAFLKFWNSPRGSEALKQWDALGAAEVPAGDARPSLRIRIDDFLLGRAIEDPVKNLQLAAERLLITSKGSSFPQPAEAHFLRMLALWPEALPTRPPRVFGLAGQALRVRRLAERAALGASGSASEYSYSEQVFPWIRTQIEAADQQRRLGEDLFFASDQQAWDRCEKALNQALLLYQEAMRRAGVIRAGLAARDRSLATLPAFAHWAAHRYSDELQNDLVPALQDLWMMTHELAARLEKPQSDAEVDSFDRARKALSQRLDLLARGFAEELSRIDAGRSNEDWESATAAASVPFPDDGDQTLRSRIWARLENIREHDLDPSSDNTSPSRLTDDQRAQAARNVRRRAEIQGLMALSSLGARWFDEKGFRAENQGEFESTLKRVRRTSEQDDEHAEPWWNGLAAAGSLIGQRWQQMAPVIDGLTDERSSIAGSRSFENQLTQADRLSRLIDGAVPQLEEPALEASFRLRHARVRDLLLAMAGRTRLDHWYDENPKEAPYYRVAGSGFVSDASKLSPGSPLVAAAQELLNQKGNLELSGQRRLILTSERSARLAYKIVNVGKLPEGIPVVRAVPDRLLELEGNRPGFRAVDRASDSDKIEFFLSSPLIRQAETDPNLLQPVIELTSLRVEGAFRGQPLACSTEVELHPVPDSVAIGPPPPEPPDASIAIRSSDEIINNFGAGNGSIAIVLDCSGSMLDPPIGATKFSDAQTALGQVLRLVPAKATVSLWTFSQLPENVPLLPDGRVNPALLPPGLREEPEQTVKRLLEPAPWDPAKTDAVIQKIAGLHPFFDTPLVWAMWRAANSDLFNAKGLKTLLVLTDGNDNRLEKNPKYNPHNQLIPDYVVAGFTGQNIRVNMVFFTPAGDPKEIAEARKNFEGALKQLEPPGDFVLANNLGELIANLKRGITQKLTCEILKPPDWTPVGKEPLDVAGQRDADKWWTSGLEPGVYKLRVHADKTYEQEIDLHKGDRIIVELVEGPGGGIAFRRALYSDHLESGKHAIQEQTEAWRLAVLADQRRRQGQDEQLRLFATLEQKPGKLGTEPKRIQQVKPARVWFRVDAQDVEHPEAEFSVRWRERIFYPAPAWQLDVPRWIDAPAGGGSARPILKAWWRGPESGSLRGLEFRLNSPGDPFVLPWSREIEDGKVVAIESLGLEYHHVEIQPGEPPQPQPCLVIRLAFPENRPYIVDTEGLSGLKTVGHEHRLYSRAGKYTGLFWPVTQDQLEKLGGVSLIALEALRSQAEAEKCTLEIKLPPPRVEDQLPGPPAAVIKE